MATTATTRSFGHRAHPNDLQALRNYTERYEYDSVGNFVDLAHRFNGAGWTRSYEYEENSLLEAGKKSNRLTRTTVGNGLNQVEPYTHDAHGNMTSMPHLAAMVWDFKDQFQQADLGGGGTAYYVYDGAGQRVRKVIESQNGARQKERLYLGGFEIYREYNGAGISLERESLHILDDKQRIALVETQTVPNGNPVNTPVPLQRYQLGNHLGSSSIELGKDGSLIAYEEYHPYGTTSFQAGRSAAEVSLKRYRYTGKERDEESGLCHFGARYYACWIGRWTTCDPIGLKDGPNLYAYVRNNPLRYRDPAGTQSVDPAHDAVVKISELKKPGDVANWWGKAKATPSDWGGKLSFLEQAYLNQYTSSETPSALRIGQGILTPDKLSPEQKAKAEQLFGSGDQSAQSYANYENRRRIVAHYVVTHPATVNLQLALYRFVRDMNPLHFALERGWQVGGGKEMFTDKSVSRLTAGAEFVAALALMYGISKGLAAANPAGATGAAGKAPPLRAVNAADLNLGKVSAAGDRIWLGAYGGKGILGPGGQPIPVPKPGLQWMEAQAQRFGGKTLQELPYGMNAMKPPIDAAKELIFNVTPAVEAGGLTALELQYILSNPALLSKTTFVFNSPIY